MREVIDFVAIEGTRLAPSVVPVVDIRSILLFSFPTAVFCFLASEKIAAYFPSKRGGINQGSHAHPDRPRRGPEASCAVQSSLQPINITGVVFSLKFVVCSTIHFNCLDFFLPSSSHHLINENGWEKFGLPPAEISGGHGRVREEGHFFLI